MTRSTQPIDAIIGRRIATLRRRRRISQSDLAEKIGGITFQQLQKYEKGSNRIAASRLYQLAGVLGVSIQYFFEDAEAGVSGPSIDNDLASALDSPGVADLVRAFSRLTNRETRLALLKLVQSMVADA
jgi:transcriptional regulator with XRE-family HTH domain